jgi:hypothetical protein
MATDYRPPLGAARRPVPPRPTRRHHTEKRRRDQWDLRAIVWTIAGLLLVLTLLALSRMLLRVWELSRQ